MNRCGSPQEKATLLRHIFAGLEFKTPETIGRAMHVMAAGPNLYQLYGELDVSHGQSYQWDWDRADCPTIENWGSCNHEKHNCEYCSYSSAPLATVTQLLAAECGWSVEEQVNLTQAMIGKWSHCEQLIFLSHFTVSLPPANTLALASVVLPALGFGGPENLSSAFLSLFDFLVEPSYDNEGGHDMYASDEVSNICFEFLKHGLCEDRFAAFLEGIRVSKQFRNILVEIDNCECEHNRDHHYRRRDYDDHCSCIDAKRNRMGAVARLLVCKANLTVE